MSRIPGIVFGDTAAGRTAVMAGSGIEVFEIVRSHREVGGSWEHLQTAYHWLSEVQLRAALSYAEAYPEEIEERLQREESWTPEAVWEAHPFSRPAS